MMRKKSTISHIVGLALLAIALLPGLPARAHGPWERAPQTLLSGVADAGDTTVVACGPFTWARSGVTYTVTGDYPYTISGGAADGSDSVVTLHLIVLEVDAPAHTICAGDAAELSASVETPPFEQDLEDHTKVGDVLCLRTITDGAETVTDTITLRPATFIQRATAGENLTPLGVVFYVDRANGTYGKALALVDAHSGYCMWANEKNNKVNDGRDDNGNGNYLTANYDTNGLVNTQNMISSATSNNTSSPAAQYCYYYDPLTQTQTTDNTPKGWYLPAFGEQSMCFAQRVVINQTLRAVSDYLTNVSSSIHATVPFDGLSSSSDYGYWTSTDYSNERAYLVNQKGETRDHEKNRNSGNVNYARAVCSFTAQPGGSKEPTGASVVQTIPPAKIGDLVEFQDGSKGVVCYVNPENPYTGWAAALQDLDNPTNQANSGKFKMGTMPSGLTTINVSNGTEYSRYDMSTWVYSGKETTEKLRASNSAADVAAVAMANSSTYSLSNGWYIPDAVQLRQWNALFPIIRETVTSNGGHLPDWAGEYWSSTKTGGSQFGYLKLAKTGSSSVVNSQSSTTAYHIRPVRDFRLSEAVVYWDSLAAAGDTTDRMTVSPDVTTRYGLTVKLGAFEVHDTAEVFVPPSFDKDTLREETCPSVNSYASVGAPSVFDGIDISYAHDTIVRRTLQTVHGCDSVITLQLTVYETKTGDTTAVACDSLTWHGTRYTETPLTAPTHTYQTVHGCDSVVTLNLTIHQSTHNVTSLTACTSYEWHGTTYSETGTHTYTYSYEDGNNCPGTDTLKLTVFPNCDTELFDSVVCAADLPIRLDTTPCVGCAEIDTTFGVGTETGSIEFIRYREGQSPLIFRFSLTVHDTTRGDTAAVACDSFTWPLNNETYDASGDYDDTITRGNRFGCDSIVTLHLTVNRSTAGDTTAVACGSFTWYGAAYTQDGDYTRTLTNAAGCDSVVTLHLSFGDVLVEKDTVVLNSYTWKGETYTGSLTLDDTIHHNACDSIVRYHFIVLEVDAPADTICAGDTAELRIEARTKMPVRPAVGDVLCLKPNTSVQETPYDTLILRPDTFVQRWNGGENLIAMGVVFYVDPNDDRHGKAIALKDASSSDCQWANANDGTVSDGNNGNDYTNDAARIVALYDLNGRTNTSHIVSSAQAYSKTAPAAENCYYYSHSLLGRGPDSLGWYLPSAGELSLYYAQRVVVNRTILSIQTTNGQYSTLRGGDFGYWTSSDHSNSNAINVTQNGEPKSAGKTDNKYVRAIFSY